MTLPQKNTAQESRVTSLDGMRGLAALLVVGYHYICRFNELYGHTSLPFSPDWATAGEYGVHLFFIISGYVIYWSLSKPSSSGQDFFVSRFARLYPAYWAAALTTWFAVAWAGLPGRELTPLQALTNITMLQEFMGFPHIDGVYWTLSLELVFYLYAFFLFKSRLAPYFEWIALTFLGIVAIKNLGILPFPGTIARFMLFDYGSFFVFGIAYYRLTHNHGSKPLLTTLIIMAAITPFTNKNVGEIHFIAIVYATFIMAMMNIIPLMESKFFLFFGSISYTLYLVHQNIGYIIIRAGEHHEIDAAWSISAAIITSILTATLITRLIERPAQAAIIRKYKSLKNSRHPTN